LEPAQSHVIGKSVNRVAAEFVSSIDLVEATESLKSVVILTSSPYARTNQSPMLVNLGMIDAPPARNLFNKQNIPTGVLLEGKFSSVFKNRLINELGIPTGTKLIAESKPAKMIFISDGALIANKVTYSSGKYSPLPLGYDKVSNVTYGNKEFLINALNYLCDDSGLMALRSRSMQMRLLDKVKMREGKTFWQLINVLLPVLVSLSGGLIFGFIRHRRFAKKTASRK
jgi:ABC-2 type transport system permease protein